MGDDEQGSVADPTISATSRATSLRRGLIALCAVAVVGAGIAIAVTRGDDTSSITAAPTSTAAASTTSTAPPLRTDVNPLAIGSGATSDVTIAASNDRRTVAVAWYAEADGTPEVRVATSLDAGTSYSKPVTVGTRLVGPRVTILDDGAIVVSAFASGEDPAAAWPVFFRSDDGGATFTKTIDLQEVVGERTNQATLPSAAISTDGQQLVVAWHDHTHHNLEHSSAPVLAVTSDDGGATWTDVVTIAPATCHCCWISSFVAGDELGVGFRDQLDVDDATDERDPAFAIADSTGVFGEVQEVHDDQWRMERDGCPASGPRFSAVGSTVHAAWWTGADQASWKFFYSKGTTHDGFGDPQTITSPGGEGDAIDGGSFAVSADKGDKGDNAWIMAAVFPVNGTGYTTLLWRATDGGTPTIVDSGSEPYGITQAGYDVVAVDGGAIIAFRDADNDTVLVKRIEG